MNQQLEYEVKNILSKENFNTLLHALSLNEKTVVKQTNYYFETPAGAFEKKNSALRIREIDDTYILTLKTPYGDGLLETDVSLSCSEAFDLIENKGTRNEEIKTLLHTLNIEAQSLVCGGKLVTYRKFKQQYDVTYFLDESHYCGIIDYELEIEAPNIETASARLHELLNKYAIPKKKAESKIARFYFAMKKS